MTLHRTPWIVFLAMLCASCARSPDLHPVRGAVLVDGKPAAGAIITFHRANDPDKTNLPHAVVQTDGTFALSTLGGQDGALAGRYLVTIIYKKKGKSGDDDDDTWLIDKKYLAPQTSGLE